jgi:hypothetical protein
MAVRKRRLSVSKGTSVLMEVVVWLRSLGLGWYEAAFRGRRILLSKERGGGESQGRQTGLHSQSLDQKSRDDRLINARKIDRASIYPYIMERVLDLCSRSRGLPPSLGRRACSQKRLSTHVRPMIGVRRTREGTWGIDCASFGFGNQRKMPMRFERKRSI